MELSDYFRFVIALAFVLGLIGLLAWGAKRSGFIARPSIASGREQRLAILEVSPLDAKHRLVLIRRDDAEHLVLLGGTSDLLIERDIPTQENAS